MHDMQKKVVVLLLLFLFVFLANKVKAQMVSDSFTKTYIGNYHYVYTDGHFGDFEHFVRNSDGKIAYCIEPGVDFLNETYQGYQSLSNYELGTLTALSEEKINYLSLIASFGWGYENHVGEQWIVATQALIWQELGKAFQFTSRNSKSNPFQYVIDTPIEIAEKILEIQNLVADYLQEPTFIKDHAKIGLHESYTFIDTQNRIYSYNIANCENCVASMETNTLKVTPNSNLNGSILLEKTQKAWEEDFIVYTHGGSQNMLTPGNVNSLKTTLSYETITGSIHLTKWDADTKQCKPQAKGGFLKDSIYKLYKSDGTYVNDLVINAYCQASLDNLEMGDYYIQEYQAGISYQLDPTKYNFSLTIDRPSYNLTVYDKMDLGQIKIQKLDSLTNSCVSSSPFGSLRGAEYWIYYRKDSANYEGVERITIGEDCTAVSLKNLAIGDYFLMESKAPEGYKLNPEKIYFSITKENVNEIQEFTVSDEIYSSTVHIHKTFLDEVGLKAEEGAIFDVYLANTMEKYATIPIESSGYGSLWLPYGQYILRQTKGIDGYKLAKDQVIAINQYNENNTYIDLVNEPYAAKLKLIKMSQGNPVNISGIRFKIYDVLKKEYVCQTINYPEIKTICEFETNEKGEFITPQPLYSSTYCIEELDQKIEGYLWNRDPLEFTIDENSSFLQDEYGNKIILVFFENEKVLGQIAIQKYGEKVNFSNNEITYKKIGLENVTFGLYQNGRLIQTGKTDANGYFLFKDLDLGTYVVKEIESDGIHLLDTSSYVLEIAYQDQYTKTITKSIDVYNRLPKGVLQFFKTDAFTSERLANAEIAIYFVEDKLIMKAITNEEGLFVIENLPLGKYYAVEEVEPNGYIKSESKLYFEIKKDNEMILLELANVPYPIEESSILEDKEKNSFVGGDLEEINTLEEFMEEQESTYEELQEIVYEEIPVALPNTFKNKSNCLDIISFGWILISFFYLKYAKKM